MLYNRRSFTLPASSQPISQRAWDFATLTAREFIQKYGEDAEEYQEQCSECGKMVSDCEWTTNWCSCSDCFNKHLDKYSESRGIHVTKRRATDGRPSG